jgi:hypothetical protein
MLTEDMTRLSAEIGNLREQRAGLIQQLVDATRQRHKSISQFRSNARGNFQSAADALRDKRVTGLNQLRREVSSVREGVKQDLDGVRRTWTGRA